MSVPSIRLVELSAPVAAQDEQRPVLLLGPALGTAVAPLWGGVARELEGRFRIIGWELPGHGGAPAGSEDFSIEELAQGVLAAVDAVEELPAESPFWYAGCSVGGAVGLQLLVDAPQRLRGAAVVASAPQLGDPEQWRERAALVEAAGTPTQVIGSAQRWLTQDFIERDAAAGTGITTGLLHALQSADRHGYAQVCRAIAAFDLTGRLGEIVAPVIAVAGEQDPSVEPQAVRDWAQQVPGARFELIEQAAHMIPAQQPAALAGLIRELAAQSPGSASTDPLRREGAPSSVGDSAQAPAPRAGGDRTASQAHADGMRVRREVLSDAHVDRSEANKDEFTAEWQDFISRYAWGEIWTRPGLDRPMRSAITLTALIAAGHWGEFEMHVRAALRNGLTREQIKEILLQSSIYLSVPSANNAFSHAKAVFDRLDAEADSASAPATTDRASSDDEGVTS
ncbi:bifunctional 3-oxoadipate enol-lactonase/4-carboxymuconolactone decarboxylase PcaDC [Kocuria palustris]|uniref:bifunctional 3-oxoadipate enol-lactonase/4-carboxymuconolactone decarboxylase PcaDC n=2 Tax=Micrococcaceae TaxID=1268 RepID=UPI000738E21D|nr:hypothetical protein AVL60_06030 [Kocuria palustris]